MMVNSKAMLLAFLMLVFSAFSLQVHADQETFKDFGERPGLVKIMDGFMVYLLADPRTRPFFENTNQTHIKAMLVDQMCELLDGGCDYQGRDMKSSHAHLQIDRADFNALVEAFQLAMDDYGVPFSSQNRLLAKLAPMYRDIETPVAAK